MSMCVCLFICPHPRAYIQNHTRNLYQFLCMLPMAVTMGGSVFLWRGDEIPREWAILGVSSSMTMHMYSIAFANHTKTAEPIEMPFRLMSGLGPSHSVLRGGDYFRRGRDNFGGNMCPTSISLTFTYLP